MSAKRQKAFSALSGLQQGGKFASGLVKQQPSLNYLILCG